MVIADGQPVDASNSNPAWISANSDDTATGKYTLANVDAVSGSTIDNVQRELNSLASFLGKAINTVFNDLPGWVNNDVGLSTDDVFTRADNLTQRFNGTLGHGHTGATGDGPRIDSVNIANTPLTGIFQQGADLTGVTGGTHDVSTELTGKSPSLNKLTLGVVVNAPSNKIILRQASGTDVDDVFKDSDGNEVFARLTEAAGVWTLTFFSLVGAVETAYNFSGSNDVRWYYQELFNPLDPATWPTYSPLAVVPSENATVDVIDATQLLFGKVILQNAASEDIGSAGAIGTANGRVANEDHVHQGVHSVSKSGDPLLFGDVTFTEGTGITLTQVGNNIEISSTGGGGGGAGASWQPTVGNGPVLDYDELSEKLWFFEQGAGQSLQIFLKVPTSYVAGTQISTTLGAYSPSSANVWRFQCVTTLIQINSTAIDSVTNQHTANSGDITNTVANQMRSFLINLTDSSGEINAVAVAPGDLLKVELTRVTPAGSEDPAEIRFVPSYTGVNFA